MEESAPGGEDAAVDRDGFTFDDDFGVAAVEAGIEEEALEVAAELAETDDLQAVARF